MTLSTRANPASFYRKEDAHKVSVLASGFLLLSGAASLTYQVIWVRLLSHSIGSTSVSVSIVLATFFTGLALGSYLTTKLPSRLFGSITPCLVAEAIIGSSALILLPVLLNLDRIVSYWPVLGQYLAFKLVLVIVLLIIPCLCIGATYPLMANIVIRDKNRTGENLGRLYSVNTIGAVMGALATGFVLVPAWGLDGAIFSACTLNFLIILFGWRYRRIFANTVQDKKDHRASENNPDFNSELVETSTGETTAAKINTIVLYIILFVTGAVALACEVGWTKYLSILTHTTLYGFSALLAIYLTGIAIGSWLFKRHVDSIRQPAAWLIALLCLLALTLLSTRISLQYLPELYQSLSLTGTTKSHSPALMYSLIFLALVLPTMVMGALFTLIIRLLCDGVSQVHRHAGRAYAMNTLGGIIGSIVAGLWLIPAWGTDYVLTLGIVLIALLPLLLINTASTGKLKSVMALSVPLLLAGAFWLPHINYQQVINASGYYFDPGTKIETPPEYRFIQEGRTGVISVATYGNDYYRLQSNSLAEAVINSSDPFPWIAETLLGLLPWFLHSNSPDENLLIGLGAGTTVTAATLTSAQSIKVVEIEPAIEAASHAIFDQGIAALKDPRTELIFDDARHHLLINPQTWDAIISQPSHPWLAGNASLFTLEYFNLVNEKLNPDGLFVQWLNLFNMNADTLRAIYQSFYQAFPHGLVLAIRSEYSMILIGAKQPVYFDFERIDRLVFQPDIKAILAKWKIKQGHDLLRFFALTREEALAAAGDSPANTDTNLLTEVNLAGLSRFPKGKESPFALIKQYKKFNILPHLPDEQRDMQIAKILVWLKKNNHKQHLKLFQQVISNKLP